MENNEVKINEAVQSGEIKISQPRWASPILWTGIIAQIIAALIFSGVITLEQSKLIEMIVAIMFEIWSVVSMANNPTNAARW